MCILAPQTCESAAELTENPSNSDNANSSTLARTPLQWRLSNTSYPLSYNIHIKTNLHRGEYDFVGNCSILVQVQHDTEVLNLHAKDLNISAVTIATFCDEGMTSAECTDKFKGHMAYNNETEILYISGNKNNGKNSIKFKAKQRYLINLLYVGVITKRNVGFYQITETEANNSSV